MAQALTQTDARTEKAESNNSPKSRARSQSDAALRRKELVERLKVKADAADAGKSTSLAGLSEEEVIAALTCR